MREFVEMAFAEVDRQIAWRGSGTEEEGDDRRSGQMLVEVDPRYFRPTEVELLLGGSRKGAPTARTGSTERPSAMLVQEMVTADLKAAHGGSVRYGTTE